MVKKRDAESKFGPTALDMKEIGKRIKPMEKVRSSTLMETFTRESGVMIKLMDMANTSMQMEQCT
jgi:hypothetical protein